MLPHRRTSTPPVHPHALLWASESTALTTAIEAQPQGDVPRLHGAPGGAYR
jgi:hypothetical protein